MQDKDSRDLRFHRPCTVTSGVVEDRRRQTEMLGLPPLLRFRGSAIYGPFDPVVLDAEELHHLSNMRSPLGPRFKLHLSYGATALEKVTRYSSEPPDEGG